MPGSPRLFSLCRELSNEHQLELLLMSQDPERLDLFRKNPEVSQVFSRIDELPGPPTPSWTRRQIHRFFQEPSFSLRLLAPDYYAQICAEVRNRCAEFDMLYVDGIGATQYVRAAPIPAVADLHDSVSLLLWRSAERTDRWIESALLRLEARATARVERQLSRHFALVITNSDVDRDEIRQLDPRCNAITIPNGVDTAFFSPGGDPPVRTRLIFTGVMDYLPNDDAAHYFIEDALPLIRDKEPNCEFWVVGFDPKEALLALGDRDGVRVTGSVPDVRPFVHEARAFVCPLRYGTGMKNKILAAMSMRCPVVATPISLDGIDAIPDEHVLVADSPEELARQCLRLIEDDELVARLCDSAQAWVEKNFLWPERGATLEAELTKLRR
jgi:glycosyltransferase involved in cell wall biosynthesis